MGRNSGVVFFLVATLVGTAMPAMAGELTDVVDAFDYENDNPIDFHLEPGFRYETETGTVAREAPGDLETGLFTELDYVRRTTAMDIGMALGLYRDLEFHLNLPIVISDRRNLRFADDVGRDNSFVFPSDIRISNDLSPNTDDAFGDAFGTYDYFSVAPENEGRKRTGVGDIMFGIAWAPFNTARTPQYASLALGFDYVAPTGRPARGTNDGVGRGVHEMQFWLGASRRFFFLEPYGGLRFVLPVPGANSLFDEPPGSTQDYVGPGMRGEITAGTEFILWSDAETNQHYVFDIGIDFGYVAAGRDYGPLFDALASSPCNGTTPAQTGESLVDSEGNIDGTIYAPSSQEVANGEVTSDDAACAWIVQQASNEEGSNAAPEDRRYFHDGITDVDAYSIVGGHAAFYLQFSQYVELRLLTRFLTQSSHFLTSANTGENLGNTSTDDGLCVDDEEYVSLNPQCGERNPFYNPTLDGVGRRFYLEGIFNFQFTTTLAFQF